MKKRILAGMMSALLVVGMAMPARAAGSDPNDSLDVEYDLGSSYTLSIPTTVTLTVEGRNYNRGGFRSQYRADREGTGENQKRH